MATVSPALGSKVFVASTSTFHFLAAADTSRVDNGGALEVWTDLGGTWQEYAFQTHDTAFGSVLVARVPISGEGSYQFTYRIREASGNIVWLSQAAGNDNGLIVIVPTTSSGDFTPLANTDETLAIDQEESREAIITRNLRFTLSDGKEGDVESFRLITLGAWSSGLAIERTKPTWFTARALTPFSGLSPQADCQLLLYQTGTHVVACLPLSLPDASSTLRGCSQGSDSVWLRSERDTAGPAQAQCIVAWGSDRKLLEVIDACTAQAKKVIDASNVPKHTAEISLAKPTWSLHNTEKAIYCTWNSLGQDYTFSGVVQRLRALQSEGNLGCFESLLLDDGWQDVESLPESQNLRGLRSFGLRRGWLDEDIVASNGESNLAAAVRTLKEQFPEIKTIGVWMTLQGYWNGLHPDSEISRSFELSRLGVRDSQAQYPYPEPVEHIHLPSLQETERFWTEYFTTLKRAGIDFVKIDNQAALDYLVGEGAAAMRIETSRTARAVARKIFGSGNLINCMAGSSRYYNEFLSDRSEAAASLRTSDDFYPNEADSHRFHIAYNATTALLDRNLSVTRDFDMFTTHHELAEYHALLRCFSNAPIYITDSEQSNKRILQRLGGLDPSGEYRVIKARTDDSVRLPSTAFQDVTGNGNGPALKLALSIPSATGALIGTWNCRGYMGAAVDALTREEIWEAFSIDGHQEACDKRFVIMYDGNTAQLLKGCTGEDSNMVLPINLASGTCMTITVAQIQSFSSFDMAILGLADKFVGLCSVLAVEETESQSVGSSPLGKDIEEVQLAEDVSSGDSQELASLPVGTVPPPNAGQLLPTVPGMHITTTTRNSGSRLLALLLFYRRDLSNARSAFLRDFFRAPLRTLWNELKAMFGGPSTLPTNSAEELSNDDSPEDMQAPKNAAPSYGTFADTSETAEPQQGDISAVSESSSDTAVEQLGSQPDQVVLTVSVAGQLVLWLPKFSPEAYSITLQGRTISSAMISLSGDCVIIDMERAAQTMILKDSLEKNWKVGITKH